MKITAVSKAYKHCYYLDEDGNEITYSSSEIEEFGIYDYAQFRSLQGKTDRNEFYEIVIGGKITLYQNSEKFYIEKDTLFFNITPNNKGFDKNGNQITYRYKQLGLIRLAVSDCGQIFQKVDKRVKDRKSFIKIIKEYNKCADDNYISYSEDRPWTKIEFGPYASIIYSKASFIINNTDGGYSSVLHNTDFNPSILPAVGINFLVFSPRVSKNFGFEISPNFSYHSYFASQSIQSTNSVINYYDIDMHYYSINLPVGLQIRFAGAGYSLGIKTGISFNYVFNSSLKVLLEEYLTSEDVYTYLYPEVELNNNQLGFYGGLSTNINKGILKPFTVDLIYNANSANLFKNQQDYSAYKMKTQNIIFSIKYTIQ